jgi:redox-sensing transcriptional repressor
MLNMKREEKMSSMKIPDIIIGRLPQYLRALNWLELDGKQTTSSQELGEHLGISAAQIRKDLSQFGGFGKQGMGYSIPSLTRELRRILHVDHSWDVALVGVGQLGIAIANYQGIQGRGFNIVLGFDSDPEKIGKKYGALTIQAISDMETAIRNAGILIAMVTVPASQAQEVVDRLIKAGVKMILNYAPINLKVPQGIRMRVIDPVIELQRMTYYLS